MWRTVLEIALALSIGTNVYLLTRHGDAPATAHAASSAATAAPTCPPVAAQPAAVTIDAAVPAAPAGSPVVGADCSAVEKKLADTEAQLEQHLPLPERYKRATRSVDVESRARAVLAPILAPLSKNPHAYDVECHGAVCKLDVIDPAISRDAWMEAVQSSGGFSGLTFSGNETYATMGTPAETAQSSLMGTIGRALNPDAGLAECAGGQKPAGTLTLDIALDPATRRLDVSATGSLANEHVGLCIRRHVQTLLDAIKAPSGVTTFDMPIPLLR